MDILRFDGVFDLIGLVMIQMTAIPLYAAQKAANRAAGDPTGKQNSKMTFANVAWCVPGVLLWLAVLGGVYVALNALSTLNSMPH